MESSHDLQQGKTVEEKPLDHPASAPFDYSPEILLFPGKSKYLVNEDLSFFSNEELINLIDWINRFIQNSLPPSYLPPLRLAIRECPSNFKNLINIRLDAHLDHHPESAKKTIPSLISSLELLFQIKKALIGESQKESRILVPFFTSQLDLYAALRFKSRYYIKKIKIPKKNQKKLVIHLPEIGNQRDVLNDSMNLLSVVFKIETCKEKTITPHTQIEKIDCISTKRLKQIISDEHKCLEDYYILDYATLSGMKFTYEDYFRLKITPEDLDHIQLDVLNGIKNIWIEVPPTKKFFSPLNLCETLESLTFQSLEIRGNFYVSEKFKKLKNVTLICDQLDPLSFNHIKNLESITLEVEKGFIDLDVSQLPQLRTVRFRNRTYKIHEIKTHPSQKNQLTFDFSDIAGLTDKDGCSKDEAVNYAKLCIKVQDFKREGFNVISNNEIDLLFYVVLSNVTNNLKQRAQPLAMQKNTEGPTETLYETNSLLDEKGNIAARNYRETLFTGIKIDENDKLVFTPFLFEEKKATPLQVKTAPRSEFNPAKLVELNKIKENSFLGMVLLSTDSPQWVPLKSRSLDDEVVLIDQESVDELKKNDVILHIHYAEETRQCFAKLESKNATPTCIDLLYAMMPIHGAHLKTEPAVLPDQLRRAIDHLSQTNSRLKELISSVRDQTPSNQIKKLIEFCSGFTSKTVDNTLQEAIQTELKAQGIHNADIHFLIYCVCDQAGECTHCSEVFMVLASYFNISARFNKNNTHAFPEYFSNEQWHLENLNYKTSADTRPFNFNTLNPWDLLLLQEKKEEYKQLQESLSENQKSQLHEEKKQKEGKNKSGFKSLFNPDPQILDESKGFAHWYNTLITSLGRSPLLEFKEEKEAWNLHKNILEHSGQRFKKNYLYLHDASDIENFLIASEIKENEPEPARIKGPLLELFESDHPNKVILINWSQLPIANYKSILDPHPTLQGYKVPSDLKIINIIQSGLEVPSLFSTRTRPVAWPTRVLLDCFSNSTALLIAASSERSPSTPEEGELVTPDRVDLYEDPDWEPYLIGSPQITENGFTFKRGSLLTEIDEKQNSIYLTGIPKDNHSFTAFFSHLACEKEFYINGKWEPLPENFKFHFTSNPKRKPISSFPGFDFNFEKTLVFYINDQNYDALFKRRSINSEKKPIPLAGLLAEIPPNSTLVFTEYFLPGKISKLEAELKRLNLTVHLKVLPHLKNNNLRSSESPVLTPPLPSTLPPSTTIILTVDINAATKRFEDQPSVKIIDISNTTEFSDLFENPELIKEEKKSETPALGKKPLLFKHQIFELFAHLSKAENTVILSGDISCDLYYSLETLFQSHPYLIINGKLEKIQGKLILITSTKKEFPHLFDSAKRCLYQHMPDQKQIPDTNEPLEEKKQPSPNEILEHSPFIELYGMPGTGKTHWIKTHLPKNALFWGEEKIIDWLQPSNDKKYLILKHANKKEPAYWNFLKGLKRSEIYYKGKFYLVNPDIQKIIFTSNLRNDLDENYYLLLEHIPRCYFKPYSFDYLKTHIILPKLPSTFDTILKNKIADQFIFAYELAQKNLPSECLSIRDIQALIDRFLYPTPPNATNALARAHLACKIVFAGLFKESEDKRQYSDSLKTHFNNESEQCRDLPHSVTYNLPQSRTFAWDCIIQCITTGRMLPKDSRRGLLVEGLSGIGKSEMMLQALKKEGFSCYDEKEKNYKKVYFHLNMGSDNISEILLNASALSKEMPVALVIDELNLLMDKDEEVLISILDPVEELSLEENTQAHGLVVLASQNSQTEESGQKPLSHTLLNLSNRIYEQPYTKQDLFEICFNSKKFKSNDPRVEEFVSDFLEEQAISPHKVNMRRFFEALGSSALLKILAQNPQTPYLSSIFSIFTKKSPKERVKDRLLKEEEITIQNHDEITALFKEFDHYLLTIQKKSSAMRKQASANPSYKNASKTWATLVEDLANERKEMNTAVTLDTLTTFQKNCRTAIESARPILENPRDPEGWRWKLFFTQLKSIILSIFSLGLINYYTNKSMTELFTAKTDSIEKIETLEKKIISLSS